MTEIDFKYPEIKVDLRPKDPLEAAARFVFDRYGYDFYFDIEDEKLIQKIEPNRYKVKVSVKRPVIIENHKTNETKELIINVKDILELEIEKRGACDFGVSGPYFNTVKALIRKTIHEEIDKVYERLFLEVESLKKKIAKPIFIRSQFNPIFNVLHRLYRERLIELEPYREKKGVIHLLRKAGYIDKRNGYYVAAEKANLLIDKFRKSSEFANYVVGDLILNHQEELDKMRFYTYKPYLKMTVIYYRKAHLYTMNGSDFSDEDILRELKKDLVMEYATEYNVALNQYKYSNLMMCVNHLIEDEVFREEEEDEDLLFGHREILSELIAHNPLGGLKNVSILYAY